MKVRKKTTLTILILALLVVFSSTIASAATPSYRYPRVNGIMGTARSSMDKTTASASTVYKGTPSTISVSSTYYYINRSNNKTFTLSYTNGGQPSTKSVNFSAPKGMESIEIRSTHRISAGGEKWSGTTAKARLD